MKISTNKTIALVLVGLGILILILMLNRPGFAQPKIQPAAQAENTNEPVAKIENTGQAPANVPQSVAGSPFIVKDTDNDSPGTNIVTRIVTITAEVGGTPPIALQWKVDKGNGFEDIPGATNATFRIGNAQVVDSGLYSLFATNSVGHLNTTPVPLIVTEGED